MDDLPEGIEVASAADGSSASANLVRLARRLAQERVDGKWWDLPGTSKKVRQQENDYHWKWAKRIGELKNDRLHEAVAVQTDDGDIQGAILYWINGKSYIDEGQGSVSVEALATAPRNRPWLVQSPRFRGVGEVLLLRAVIHSDALGLRGRTNLVAFNDAKTVAFYQNRGFAVVGNDDDLPIMELAPDAAQSWLRNEGYLHE